MAADQPSQKQGKTSSASATTTGATSPNNATKKPKERVPNKVDMTEINATISCEICFGYLIDATAIIECGHTFCKSCILNQLGKNGFCPSCGVEVNAVKPHLSLRSDVILQRLVYKLVPNLLVSELRRRKDHAEGKENVGNGDGYTETMALEVDSASDLSTILSLDDVVSLSIEYFRGSSTSATTDESTNVTSNVKPKTTPQKPEKLSTSSATSVQQTIEDANVNCSGDANDRRYLKCPSAVSVGLLKKFIRMKYGLSDDYRVDLLYNGVRDNSLESELTLLDVAFIFKWNKDEPMRFHYQIFDRSVKTLPTRAGSKRSASSMMDDPPDDDAPSGPHNNNRPPMTSASPSSKFPRVSNNSSGANSSGGRTGGSSRTTSHTHTTTVTSSTSPSTPVYDFEGNSESEEPIQPMTHKGKLKLRGFRKQETSNNAIESSSSKSSQGSKRSPTSHKRSSVDRRRSSGSGSGSGKSPARSNSVGTTGESDDHSEDADSDSSSSDDSDDTKTAELTNSRVRSAAQTVMASQVNGSIKLNMSSEKREPLKMSLGAVLAKSPEHKHKHKHHHKMKHKKKHKALKISLSLNPVSTSAGGVGTNRGNANVTVNQSQNNHNKPGASGPGKAGSGEGKGPKLIFGLGQNKTTEVAKVCGGNAPTGSTNSQTNFPVNVKPTTSAHLSNMSKSISVSIGVGNNTQKPGNNTNQATATLAKKMLNSTTTTLVPKKNSGIEIQPTTLPTQTSNSSSKPNQSSSSARSHPLLPDSVHVPKSVTLIPVNPTGGGGGGGSNSSSNTTTSSGGGRGGGNISSGNVMEKSGSVSSSSGGSSTSTRLNAHTFTHPITNKSLHQITVTEVPPPPKSGGSSPASNSSSGSANNLGNNSNITISNSSSGGGNVTSSSSVSNNPIEKVIANAANKPQFNGPGSMEITKIYCNSKENPTKKLKERKGLDISITVPPGMNIKDKNKTSKLEETLRQKMGLHNNSSPNPGNSPITMNNKIKGNNGPNQGPLFNVGCNAKMPPGITIGPAGGNKQSSISGGVGSSSGTSGNTIPGLGFSLPPHITAHPQHPPTGAGSKQLVVNQMKSQQQQQHQGGDIKPSMTTCNKGKNVQMGGGNKAKDLPISCLGTGGGGTVPKGNQTSKAYENRKQLGEAFASMIDMANRNALKSPSPPKPNSQQVNKDHHTQHHKTSGNTGAGVKLNQANSNCEKRALDMSSSSSSRKNSRESPEPKRSKTNESSTTPKSSSNESPLDLSGTGRPNSRPNSNSSSPIHHQNVKTTHSHHSSSSTSSHHVHEKVMKHNEPLPSSGNSGGSGGGKKCPTPVPKISPPSSTTTPPGFPSPSSGGGKSGGGKVSTPTGSSPSILSIAQNLAQKQLNQQQQQQQQKEQFLHSQIMHLQQGLQNMHAPQTSHPHHQQQQGGKSGGSLHGNSLSPKGSHHALNSLSPPLMSLPNPSPPGGGSIPVTGFDPLRNLLTLSDAAVAARHGKVHPMNSLMTAVGLHPHHSGLSLPSPSVTSASLFPHLVNSLGGGKPGGGMLDATSAHAYLAAISAHNERLAAAAAGMGGIFHGDSSMSPPMGLGAGGSFFSQQVRPNSPHGTHGSLRIPSVPSSPSSCLTSSNKGSSSGSGSSNINHGKNNIIKQQGSPPLTFSQHSSNPGAPRSPNKTLNTSSSSAGTTSVSSHSNKSHHHDSSSSGLKPNRINGTTPSFSGHLPIFPPGIHNPILPTYSRSLTTTNCSSSKNSQSPISSLGYSASKSTTGLDKSKGIPNSMKISNFLPSKPKDGKGQPDNSQAEATIISGSNVGGGSSLSQYLNSIQPLIVSGQSNLSVSSSSSTLSKEHTSPTSSRGLTGSNKSSNEQDQNRSKSKSSDPKSISPSLLHNPIKMEPSEKKPIITSSSIPLKSTLNDPITCQSVAGSGLVKSNEEKAAPHKSHHSSFPEIKSEGGTTLMSPGSSSSSSKLGIFSLGSPPAGRSTTTTTNQAVRHIPNPALLFNRQNSSNAPSTTAQIPCSPVTSPTNSNEYGKSLPFSQKSPSMEQVGLSTLPFPGVSVPVQVKVDDDVAPIPIPTPKPKPSLVQQLKNLSRKASSSVSTEPRPAISTEIVTENNLLIAQPPNKEVDIDIPATVTSPSRLSVTSEQEETTNQICKAEEIVKIEYTTEDADLDIDVGIETAPSVFLSENNENEATLSTHQNDDEKLKLEHQQAPSISSSRVEIDIEVGEVISSSEQIEGIPSSSEGVVPVNEIKTETTSSTLDTGINDEVVEDTTKTDTSPNVTSQDDAETKVEISSEISAIIIPTDVKKESETISVDVEKTELQVSPNSLEKLGTEPTLPETGLVLVEKEEKEKMRQVETEKEETEVVEQVEKVFGGETETETGMEVEEENEKVESGSELPEMEKKEEKSGEIPAPVAVEMSEVVTTDPANSGEILPSTFDKSAELQIESMECEQEQGAPLDSVSLDEGSHDDHDHRMETEVEEAQDHELVPMSVDDKKDEILHKIVETAEPISLSETGASPVLPFAIANTIKVTAPEILVAQEQSCSATTAQEIMVTDTDQVVQESSSNEDDLPAATLSLPIHTSNPNSEIQTKDLNSEESESGPSNSILNQITINPEALQELEVADTDITIESANFETVEVEPSLKNEASLTDNNSPNNTDTILITGENEGEEKLTESSSTSQLELNCPSAETNGIELSNPVTETPSSSDSPNAISEEIIPTVPVVHVQLETMNDEDMGKSSGVEECKNVQTSEPILPAGNSADMEELVVGVENKMDEICPTSVLPEVEEIVADIASPNKSTTEISFDTPTINDMNIEFDLELTFPPSEPSLTFEYQDGDVEMVDESQQQIVSDSMQNPIFPSPSPPPTTFTLGEDSPISSHSSLISATATITTTTAEMGNNVMSSSMESPISCRNSLESPTSPSSDDNINKMETLEQVAAGLFASAAANTINNNNNKTINAPSCEIAITTTSANDMATVVRREACLHN